MRLALQCLYLAICLAVVSALDAVKLRNIVAKMYENMGSDAQLPSLQELQELELRHLDIHLVCHTHDDVGWLKTVDQYYMGANNSIQHAGVQYVLDSVVAALADNPARKFIYVEIAFFTRWWSEQNDLTRQLVKQLVARGQLEFINGGWAMNDEATPNYVDIIDQMTEGHRFLLDTFGVTPTVGWHIDPFGHAAWQPVLFAKMGFDSFFFGRIDYQDFLKRAALRQLEFTWTASPSLPEASLLGGVTWSHYSPPPGMCFDQFCHDPPVQNDPALEGFNVGWRSEEMALWGRAVSLLFRSPHVMFTMGDDFQYENANEWFKNLDKILDYIEANPQQFPNVSIFYSTPSEYAQAVLGYASNVNFPTKTDDFFPYADDVAAYWSGYFTSRPALKGYVRAKSGYLQTCRQLELLSSLAGAGAGARAPQPKPRDVAKAAARLSRRKAVVGDEPSSEGLAVAMALAQHHDAVSGTEKQHVADDYAKRIAIGHAGCEQLTNTAMTFLNAGFSSPSNPVDTPIDALVAFTQCELLNVTNCNVTESGQDLAIVIWNPLPRARTQWMRLPVAAATLAVTVFSAQTNASVPSQLTTVYVPPGSVSIDVASAVLFFEAQLPPLGYATYFLLHGTPTSSLNSFVPASHHEPPLAHKAYSLRVDDTLTLANNYMSAVFNTTTGRFMSLTSELDGVSVAVDQTLEYWVSSTGTHYFSQPSGAYIFRPNGTSTVPVNEHNLIATLVQTSDGPLVQEVYQVFSPWAYQVVRLYADATQLEVEYTIGPIPINDGKHGKEVITRWTTSLKSNETFYTDSLGRELQFRRLNYRPSWPLIPLEPVAGNYFPINHAVTLMDENTTPAASHQLTILTDRSVGGTSLMTGQVELMLHRRLLDDDHRGVGEPLNETANGIGLIIRSTHLVALTPAGDAASHVLRTGLDNHTFPATPFFSPLTTPGLSGALNWTASNWVYYSGMNANGNLPVNVHLLTLQWLSTSQLLLRLAHQFAIKEHSELSQPVVLNLFELFSELQVTNVTEVTLTTNQVIGPITSAITMDPMDIRSFLLAFIPLPPPTSKEF